LRCESRASWTDREVRIRIVPESVGGRDEGEKVDDLAPFTSPSALRRRQMWTVARFGMIDDGGKGALGVCIL
jgi:hypothetical protein